jgi:hypothetical protein
LVLSRGATIHAQPFRPNNASLDVVLHDRPQIRRGDDAN